MPIDDKTAQQLINRLKIVGIKFEYEQAALQQAKDLLEDLELKGNLGMKFIEGFNLGLSKAADIIGWGEDRTELRNQVLELRVKPAKQEE